MTRVQCKSSRWQMFFKIGIRPATFLRRHSNTGVFLWNLRNLEEHLILQNNSTLMATSGSKQCKPLKTYNESLSCRKKKWHTWTLLLRLVFLDNEYSSEVLRTLLAVPHFSNVARKSQKQSSRGVLLKRCFWKFRKPKAFYCEFCKIFKNIFFHRTPLVAASVINKTT